MTRPLFLTLAVLAGLSAPLQAAGGTERKTSARLPNRPLMLTRGQYEALRKVAGGSEHASICTMQATYRDKGIQVATDAGQVTFLAGLGGGILTVLICAAPL
jgi:hypothetical protein